MAKHGLHNQGKAYIPPNVNQGGIMIPAYRSAFVSARLRVLKEVLIGLNE